MECVYDADTNEYLGTASDELACDSMDANPTGIVRAWLNPQSCLWEPSEPYKIGRAHV